MKNNKFLIIGAGAEGQAIAAHLAILGAEITLYNRGARRIASIQEKGGIELAGAIENFGKINKVTSNLEGALGSADIIIITVPAYAHNDIAEACSLKFRDGQMIILMPGRTGGAIEFTQRLRRLKIKKELIIAETPTAPYSCRLLEERLVIMIYALKRKVPIAAFPSRDTRKVIEALRAYFPQFIPAKNVLETSLSNVGCILHPAPTLFNIGWIENLKTQFIYYYEGITPTIAKILEEMDVERVRVAEALGVNTLSVRLWLKEVYGSAGDSLYEALQNTASYRWILAPPTLNHRYIWEDVPTGLVPIASLGSQLGVKTPTMNLIIDLACKACSFDFRRNGRTMKSLGLSNLGSEKLKELVYRGYGKKFWLRKKVSPT